MMKTGNKKIHSPGRAGSAEKALKIKKGVNTKKSKCGQITSS
jgi:hypothetical protein